MFARPPKSERIVGEARRAANVRDQRRSPPSCFSASWVIGSPAVIVDHVFLRGSSTSLRHGLEEAAIFLICFISPVKRAAVFILVVFMFEDFAKVFEF
jgi:hypothetical protein